METDRFTLMSALGQSAAAAKEIKGLISASSAQVATGVHLVGETGKSLTSIVTQVSAAATDVSEISASSQEQATGLQEVNTAVTQMDQLTQQNAAMVEESTAASHSLIAEVEKLRQLIDRFKVDNTPGSKSHEPSHEPRFKNATRPALKTFSSGRSGGAALKSEPKANEWADF